ncbi:hypothetical protein ACLOJK_037159, partial [Asimina triloba]
MASDAGQRRSSLPLGVSRRMLTWLLLSYRGDREWLGPAALFGRRAAVRPVMRDAGHGVIVTGWCLAGKMVDGYLAWISDLQSDGICPVCVGRDGCWRCPFSAFNGDRCP